MGRTLMVRRKLLLRPLPLLLPAYHETFVRGSDDGPLTVKAVDPEPYPKLKNNEITTEKM